MIKTAVYSFIEQGIVISPLVLTFFIIRSNYHKVNTCNQLIDIKPKQVVKLKVVNEAKI